VARVRGLLGLLAAATLLAGCHSGRGAGPSAAPERPVQTAGEAPPLVMDRSFVAPPAIRMRFQDGGLRYTAGCNLMTATVGWDGNRLVLSGGASTAKLCEGQRGADEQSLNGFLRGRPSVRLDGSELTLTSPDRTLRLLDRKVAEPNRPFEETGWLLRSVTVDGAPALVPSDKQPFLIFREGRFFGGTTCNDYSGNLVIGPDGLDLSGLQVGPVWCTEPMATIERGLLSLVAGPVQERVTGDQLVITNDDGATAEFVARDDGF